MGRKRVAGALKRPGRMCGARPAGSFLLGGLAGWRERYQACRLALLEPCAGPLLCGDGDGVE